MNERLAKANLTFKSFETRREFVKEAIAAGVHRIEPLNSPDSIFHNDWVFIRNILGVFYGTDATLYQIAHQYNHKKIGISPVLVDVVVTVGTIELWKNSPPEIQKKYPMERFSTWKPPNMEYETDEESKGQFANDRDLWNEAVKRGLLGKLRRYTNVAVLSEYFASGGNSQKPRETDLEDLSLVVAKYAK